MSASPNSLPDSYFQDMPGGDTPLSKLKSTDIKQKENDYSKYAGKTSLPDDYFTSMENPSFVPRVGGDLLAGLGEMGRGLINSGVKLANNLAFPDTQKELYKSAGINTPQIPEYRPDFNYSSAVGVNNPNLADKIVQGAAQYSPYALGGEAALGEDAGAPLLSAIRAKNTAATGATFGGTQSENPGEGALIGAATNLASLPVGTAMGKFSELLPKAFDSLKDYFSKFASPAISQDVNKSLEGARQVDNNTAFQMAKQNLEQNWLPKEKDAWTQVTSDAKNADNNSKFDDSSYTSSLKNESNRLSDLSGQQSGYSREYPKAISYLNGYAGDSHATFTDAIEHNKALNSDYAREMAPGDNTPIDAINFAKNKLFKTIQENIDNNAVGDSLGSSWKNARDITQAKNQVFNTVTGSTGKDTSSSFSHFLNGKGVGADPSSFVSQYVPRGAADGIQGMKQLSQMMGDEDSAKNVIKSNYFGNSIRDTSGNYDPSKFMSKYNNLSNEQQSYLFGTDKPRIDALSKIIDETPGIFKKGTDNHSIMSNWLGGLLGFVGGAHFGGIEGSAVGTAAGNAAQNLYKNAFQKAFSSNRAKSYVINRTLNPSQENYSGNTLGKNLSRALQATTTPGMVKKEF